jgi:Tfp pilus assembly protein PilO
MGAIVRSIVNFIVPLMCLSVCVISVIFVVYPFYKSKPAVEAKIAEKQKLSQVLESKIIILNKLADFKTVLTENSQLVDKVLVSEANVPQLLDEVYQIATNVGMKVTRLNYSYGDVKVSADATGTYQEVNVSLGTDGNYDQLITFLQDTEVAARILYGSSFRYTVNQDGEMSMNFTVVSPFLFVQSTAVTDEPVELDVTTPSFVEFTDKLKTLKFYDFLNKDIKVIEEEETKGTTE